MNQPNRSLTQPPDAPVDIAEWTPDEDFEYYPEGTREKRAIYCPSSTPHAFLVSSHRYLFKHSIRRHPIQYWSEIIAFKIGQQLGIPVPPAFVAWDSIRNESGALIEWFYGYPDSEVEIYDNGGTYMKMLIMGYDIKKGRQHNFETVSKVMRILARYKFLLDDWVLVWGNIFLLDSLTGNTDRHQDNWGVIWSQGTPRTKLNFRQQLIHTFWHFAETKSESIMSLLTQAKLAPAFDNGTSLGYEILDENLPRFRDGDYLDKYIRRGTHHMKWMKTDEKKTSHPSFMTLYAERYPRARDRLLEKLGFDSQSLREALLALSKFVVPVPLTAERVEFILSLIERRRDMLASSLS